MEYNPDIETLKTAWRYFIRLEMNTEREQMGLPLFTKEEMDERLNSILADIWQDGREAFAVDLIKPEGFYPTTPNPFTNIK